MEKPMKMKAKLAIAGSVLIAVAATANVGAQQNAMSFFITSEGTGKGADLGGIAGADAHCQKLAAAAGSKRKTWRAYLSTTGDKSVNARDRIGKGPWHNVKGELIAKSVDDLHSAKNNINKQTALSEKGQMIPGSGDKPHNMHDILTGSDPQGRAVKGDKDSTCSNWTSSAETGSAIVGHHNRQGLDDSDAAKSWNSSHPSRGCGVDNLRKSGGAGLIYCFAVN
jgi:hypothetical protein